MKTKKNIFMPLAMAFMVGMVSLVNVYADQKDICPAVTALHYQPGNPGVLTAPPGWHVVTSMAPSCSDNTPVAWAEAAWQQYKSKIDISNHIQCFYNVKGYDGTACGGWTILRNQASIDPWLMKDHANWFDAYSHVTQPGDVYDYCQSPISRTSCFFPTTKSG